MATTSIGAPGVTFPDATVQSTANSTTSVPVLNVYTSSATWTKPATVKAIKVTVVGGGGSGGSTSPNPSGGTGGSGGGGGTSIKVYPAPSLPGPQPYTVGGIAASSSFGVAPATVITATGGATGTNGASGVSGAGGIGSGGTLNTSGSGGGGGGGSSMFGGGAKAQINTGVGFDAQQYGGGGGGGNKLNTGNATNYAGGVGTAGVVIVEEFY